MQFGHSPTHGMYFGYANNPIEPMTTTGRLVSPLLDLREVYPPITLSFSYLLRGVGVEVEAWEEEQSVISRLGLRGFNLPAETTNQWMRSSIDLSFCAAKHLHTRMRV